MGSAKHERVLQLVAVCVKKNLTPKKTGFCDFILRMCATYYSYEKRTAKKYVDILIQSFRFNRWIAQVKNNGYLEEEEQEKWILQHSPDTC